MNDISTPSLYPGIYRGIIIANNDPDGMGRVKVFVPSVNVAMFDGWFSKEGPEGIMFSGLGANLESALTPELMEKLHMYLPWSEVAQPIFGMSSGGGYNAGSNSSHLYSTPNECSLGNDTAPVKYAPNSKKLDVVNGKVNPSQLNEFLEEEIKNSKLNGYIPKDGHLYGVDGSPKSWANYFTKMAQYESGFKSNLPGPKNDPGGSHGLFQVSTFDGKRYNSNPTGKNWTLSELEDPVNNARTAIKIHEKNVMRSGLLVNNTTGKGAGGYFASATMRKIKANTTPISPKTTNPENTPPMTEPPNFNNLCNNNPVPPGNAFTDTPENTQNLAGTGLNKNQESNQ